MCPSCGKVQPAAPGATHFDVFGLPRSYTVDGPALEKQYRELSLKLHPDRFAKADAKERRISLEQTSALNDAYKTLRDPVRRAFYLLKLHGLDLDREDAGAQKNMPMEFLEEVMELREELDQAKKKKDVEKAQSMAGGVEKKRKGALEIAVSALQKLEQNGADKAALQTASFELARVRYFQRFLEEVAAIEEEQL
ncbi:MAG: Fe-S protein assembly co-chaperone HscB [Myxococcaceae bacterium]